jgi:hypothetical protein
MTKSERDGGKEDMARHMNFLFPLIKSIIILHKEKMKVEQKNAIPRNAHRDRRDGAIGAHMTAAAAILTSRNLPKPLQGNMESYCHENLMNKRKGGPSQNV